MNQKLKWLVTDHLGSTRMEVGKNGALSTLRRHDYAPFGEELQGGQRVTTGYGYTTAGARQKFTGYEKDSETGLDFAQARYYANVQGRFMSVDPFNPILEIDKPEEFLHYIHEPQNWNRYVYTWNNPLRFTDPNGENVYVVLYTNKNDQLHGSAEPRKGLDLEFKALAEKTADQIRSSKGFDPKKDTVLLRGVSNKQELQKVVDEAKGLQKGFGKVASLTYIGHAWTDHYGGPTLPGNHTLRDYYVGPRSFNFNWENGAKASFIACGIAGYPKIYNYAQWFANTNGVATTAFTGQIWMPYAEIDVATSEALLRTVVRGVEFFPTEGSKQVTRTPQKRR